VYIALASSTKVVQSIHVRVQFWPDAHVPSFWSFFVLFHAREEEEEVMEEARTGTWGSWARSGRIVAGRGVHGTGSMVLMNGEGLWHNDEHVPAATELVDMCSLVPPVPREPQIKWRYVAPAEKVWFILCGR
jgi:hypothetical protein